MLPKKKLWSGKTWHVSSREAAEHVGKRVIKMWKRWEMTAQELGRKEKMTNLSSIQWWWTGDMVGDPTVTHQIKRQRSTGIIRTRPIGVWYVSHQSHCSPIPTYHGHP